MGPAGEPGTPRQALADAVRELVTGAPGSLDKIGQRMRPPRTRQRISEWQRGQRVPQIGDLEALARACSPRSLPPEQWSRLWSRLRRGLTAATAVHTVRRRRQRPAT